MIRYQKKQGTGRLFERSEVIEEPVFGKQLGNTEGGGQGSRKQKKNHQTIEPKIEERILTKSTGEKTMRKEDEYFNNEVEEKQNNRHTVQFLTRFVV